MEFHYRLSQYVSEGEVLGLAKARGIKAFQQEVIVEKTQKEMAANKTPAQLGQDVQGVCYRTASE